MLCFAIQKDFRHFFFIDNLYICIYKEIQQTSITIFYREILKIQGRLTIKHFRRMVYAI